MNSASFGLSITALVLILDISCFTRLLRESSCHANRWTDNTRLFRALQSRNWNARFCSTKKKLKGKRKRPKKWNYTLINLCHPVKCIHRLRCLHFEESCFLLIAERRGFDNTEWIRRSLNYLPQQFFTRQIIFKAREYLIKKNTIGDQVFISFNQLQIYQVCFLCDTVRDRKCVMQLELSATLKRLVSVPTDFSKFNRQVRVF